MGKAPSGPVPVVVMGLGSIGREIALAAQRSPELELVGAVDLDSQRVGKDLSKVLGEPGPRLKVARSLQEAVGKGRRPLVLHATGSRLPQVSGQLMEALELGLSVVSTCEELAFPYLKHAALAERLDKASQKAGVTLLGTGVNPGFVMDRLAAVAGQACGEVRRANIRRVVDARTRREALQRKIGAGLTEEAFWELVDKEQLGHVGLAESAALCALGLGMDCDDFEEEISPVLAEEDINDGAFPVKKGRVAGIAQTVIGLEDERERVRLELVIALGVEDAGDRLELDADPPLELLIKGGVAGDSATAHLVVNAAPRVAAAEAGLLTVLELPSGR